MGTNNGNGNRPKVELEIGQEARLRLMKDKPYIGENSVGKYFLYSVLDLGDNQEKALFATNEIHQIISEHKLGKESEFNLKRNKNGKPGSSKLELSLVSAAAPPPQAHADNLKEIMRQCLAEAIDIVRSLPDIPFQNDDIRAICASLFIARTRG